MSACAVRTTWSACSGAVIMPTAPVSTPASRLIRAAKAV